MLQEQAPRRYLLAYCLEGRLNNQLDCLRHTLVAAQALSRTMIVPTSSAAFKWGTEETVLDYQFRWDLPVDWQRMQRCLGQGPANSSFPAVVTLEEYLKLENVTMAVVDHFECVIPEDQGSTRMCYGFYPVTEAFKALHKDSLQLPGRKEVEAAPRPATWDPTLADLQQRYGDRQEKVLCLGEMFPFWGHLNSVELKAQGECEGQTLWLPHPAIVGMVQRLKDQVLGEDYWALHLRRGDFYECRSKKQAIPRQALKDDFPPLADLALRLRQTLEEGNASVLYIATDARPYETKMLRSLIQDTSNSRSRNITVRFPSDWVWSKQESSVGGALELQKLASYDGKCGVFCVVVDMLLCTEAKHFIPSRWSTMSYQVMRMRSSTARTK